MFREYDRELDTRESGHFDLNLLYEYEYRCAYHKLCVIVRYPVVMDLQALEDKLRIDIDPAFFENEQDFR